MVLAYHIIQDFAKLPDVFFMMWGVLVRFSFDTATGLCWRYLNPPCAHQNNDITRFPRLTYIAVRPNRGKIFVALGRTDLVRISISPRFSGIVNGDDSGGVPFSFQPEG